MTTAATQPETEERTERKFPLKEGYRAIVFDPRRPEVVSRILRKTAASDNLFMEGAEACREKCMECPKCEARKAHVAHVLSREDTYVWEVWKIKNEGEPSLAGIIYFTRILPGRDAIGHYVFFDESLGSDKTELMERIIEWAFSDHGNWKALNRLTVEIPDYAFALARHSQRKLDFGGPYTYEMGGKEVAVEGVKRRAIRWRGDDRDLLVMGLLNDENR